MPLPFPSFYHPLYVGQVVSQRAEQQDSCDGGLLEFPLVWTEAASTPGWRWRFQRVMERTVFGQWTRRPGQYALVGEPGAGKTTLLREWRLRLDNTISANVHKLGHFYVPLREVRQRDIEVYFQQEFRIDVRQFTQDAPADPLIWLFDGWDELASERKVGWRRAIQHLPGVRIVSCRTAYYHGEFGEPHFLMGLLAPEQQEFLHKLADVWSSSWDASLQQRGFSEADGKWGNLLCKALQRHTQLRQLAGSPLLLTLIAYLCPPGSRIALPKDRVAFYQEAFRGLFVNRLTLNPGDPLPDQTRDFLERLALAAELMPEIPATVVHDVYARGEPTTLPPEATLREALRESGILQPNATGSSWRFLHLTFQEWLLAEALCRTEGLLPAVKRYWCNPIYEEVLGLLWGLSTSSERVEATGYLIDQGCQDVLPRDPERLHMRSGLRVALHAWRRSGLSFETEPHGVSLARLMTEVEKTALRSLAVAYDEAVPTKILCKLGYDSDGHMQTSLVTTPSPSVAQNPDTPAEKLRRLAEDPEMRGHVAGNPNTPAETLRKLAADPDPEMRSHVAGNPNTPARTLRRLATDANSLVRHGVAQNPDAPAATLRKLAENPDRFVRRSVAQNPNTPAETLRRLAADLDDLVRRGVALNSHTLTGTLRKLAEDRDRFVRRSVAQNLNTPAETLRKLIGDPDENVHRHVAQNRNVCLEWL